MRGPTTPLLDAAGPGACSSSAATFAEVSLEDPAACETVRGDDAAALEDLVRRRRRGAGGGGWRAFAAPMAYVAVFCVAAVGGRALGQRGKTALMRAHPSDSLGGSLLTAARRDASDGGARGAAAGAATAATMRRSSSSSSAASSSSTAASSSDSSSSSSSIAIQLSNEYERGQGWAIGEGLYPYVYLAQIYAPTRLEVIAPSDEFAHAWYVTPPGQADVRLAGAASEAAAGELLGASVEYTFTVIGAHAVRLVRTPSPLGGESIEITSVDDDDDGEGPFGHGDDDVVTTLEDTYEIMVKYVRREVRTLTDADRESFFDALHVVYSTSQGAGQKQFGSKFRSIEYLVAEHLQGAASRECDHWHDDAGILTHHMAFTLELEQSLQAIDASVSIPYWDYTHDEYYLGENFRESQIFNKDWFGAASPENHDHAIDDGRWAYTRIARVQSDTGLNKLSTDAVAPSEFGANSVIANPYGLLRSPWNTDDTPFLTRNHEVLGVQNGGFNIPGCQEFKEAFEHNQLGYMLSELNGLLHGPVHIMIGGQWFFNEHSHNLTTLITAARLNEAAGFFLLSSKFLWRQGYVRCPEFCSLDTPAADCSCTCPSELTEGKTPLEMLTQTGLLYLNNGWLRGDFLKQAGMDFSDVWDLFCHIGHVGEMFTSAAPYDPTFWPLHGLAERFLTLKRIYAAEGLTHFNETWDYTHASTLASDTHVVCDWSNVTGMGLPECAPGICSGHRAHDLLPMGGFVNGTETYTNREFYEFTSPFNAELPYVYDSFTKWDACVAQNISFKRSHSAGASGVTRAAGSQQSETTEAPADDDAAASGDDAAGDGLDVAALFDRLHAWIASSTGFSGMRR